MEAHGSDLSFLTLFPLLPPPFFTLPFGRHPIAFFGGSTSDYAATADCQTYYRNIVFWEGEDASSEEGATVTATIA